MELVVKEFSMPKIECNIEQIKEEVAKSVAKYETLVYTDDQIKDAKADRAMLNKFCKALSDERIRVKKECLRPYDEFEMQLSQVSLIIQKPIQLIDKQIKEYEQKLADEKMKDIMAAFSQVGFPDFVEFPMIWNAKWQNATFSMKAITEEMEAKKQQIENDMSTLDILPEYAFEAKEVYKTTLDVTRALSEAKRMTDIAKKKAEEEAKKNEAPKEEIVARFAFTPDGVKNVMEEPKQWVGFQAYVTVSEARELKKFFDDRAIKFKSV